MKFNGKRLTAALTAAVLWLCEADIPVYAQAGEADSLETSVTGQGPEEIIGDETVIYEQEFPEEGIKVTLNDKEEVIPEQADVSITLIEEENGLEYIKGEIQNKMEAVTAERMKSSNAEDQSLFGRYYDLTPVVEDVYAVDFEITYPDDAGNLCIFEPEDGQTIEVSIEADGLADTVADEMCEAELFHNPPKNVSLYGSRQSSAGAKKSKEAEILTENAVADGDRITFDAEHFSIYTVAVVRYAADADSEVLAAQTRAWNIINTYVDPEYFLTDPYKSTMNEAQYQELRAAAENAAAGYTAQYDKIKAVTEFVAERTYYDYKYISDKKKYPTYVKPYEVYTQKRTVCAGYSYLLNTLLISIGIPCIIMPANNHAYNAAYDSTNQRWIFMDSTWCSGNKYTVDDEFQYGGHSTHYFDMPLEEIAKLTSHEVYSIDGLLDGIDNSAYYRMETEHDTTQPKDDLIWRKGNWHLAVSGSKKNAVKTAPRFADLEVTEVADRAFYENPQITAIDLSSSNIESIGYASFYECKSLETVKVPPTLNEIDEFSFNGCEKLKNMDLSSTKVMKVSKAAFQSCKSLETVKVPSALNEIGGYAFNECEKLKNMDLSSTKVTKVDGAAFQFCKSLKTVNVSSTLNEIGGFAFNGCGKLKKMDLSSTKVKKIDGAIFQSCKSLESVDFPAGLKEINDYAFFNCSKLKEINLAGTKASSIGYVAFYGCNKAKNIYLPSTVKSIGKLAFACSSRSSVKTTVVTPLSEKKMGSKNKKKNIWGQRTIKRIPVSCKIKFYGNGATDGTMKIMFCGKGLECKISPNKFRREGYRFTGWNTKKNGKGKTYKNKAKIKDLKKNGKTMKLYAQWKKL